MVDSSSYDASNHPTLVKNQDKMPWKKLVNVLNSYLDSTRILFQRSEIFINPERRIQGVRIDDKMIRLVILSVNVVNDRRRRHYNEKGDSNLAVDT